MDVEKARTFQEKAAKPVDAENSPHEEVDAVLDDIERDVTIVQTHARNLIFFERKGLDEEFVSHAFHQYLDLIVELSNDTLLRVIPIMNAIRPDGSPVCDSHHRARKLWRLLGHCRDMAESFIKDPGTRDYLL